MRKPDRNYKIEKNTVQETLILPLYSRKLCTELYPNLYRDETAVRLIEQIPLKTVAYSVPKNKSLIRTVDEKTARIRDFVWDADQPLTPPRATPRTMNFESSR